jgi:hypothetical protein
VKRVRALHRPPRVSVVIASYRWPEALRLSLESALAQTVEDLEVLVVEDGPDRSSRAVVRAAADRRAKWLSLPATTGSQARPNALGVARARAPVVAYLGHDDIWHPEHLAELLDVLGPGVDVAHAVTVMLGPGAPERVALAGCATWTPAAFVPPSSVAHWRVSGRVGEWISPESSGLPIDYAFLVSAHDRGATFRSSEVPTVFKFPAAWRLDSYQTRDVGPQISLRRRLRADAGVGRRLVAEARAAGVPGEYRPPTPAAPGVIADYNRRFKGLPARFSPPLTCWTPSQMRFPGWHPAESDERGPYAWTGPEDSALVRLDPPGTGQLGVRLRIRHAVDHGQLDRLAVELDGTEVALSRTLDPGGEIALTGWLDRGPRAPVVEVRVRVPTMVPGGREPTAPDPRRLGVAVSEIRLLARPNTDQAAPGGLPSTVESLLTQPK